MAALGVMATAWALAGCGGTESGVVSAEGSDGAEQAVEVEAEQSTAQRIETVDAEVVPSRADAPSDNADAASSTGNVAAAGALSPEDMTTGPVLQWTEFDPAIDGSGTLFSIGDGRVVIRGEVPSGESQLLSTSDGSDWSAVPLPSGLSPHTLDLTGARWAVAGWSYDDPSDFDLSGRIYISDNRGVSWTEATLQIDPPDLPEYAIAYVRVIAVATSGAQVVALTTTHLDLDIQALLADRGLIPAGAEVHGISVGGGQVDVWLFEESPEADSHDESPQRTGENELRFTVDELDLSAEQLAIMGSPISGESIRVYSGTGAELSEVATLEGWRTSAVGNDDGFVLLTLTGREEVRRLTSPDGEDWTSELLDPSLVPGWVNSTALGADGAVWIVSSDGTESHVTKWGTDGADHTTTWLGRLSSSGEFSVGPAGLATLAFPPPPDPPAGTSDDSGLPTGRVAKDGYELRYGEPEGGISLWDMVADEPVYEFGPEIIESGELPEGVREVDDGDIFELTFEDPVTGEELVTFTLADLEAVVGAALDSPDWPDMDLWVGWSSDGTDWGWQDAREAFGLGDVEAHVVVAVGSDFVIASVRAFTSVGASDSGSLSGALSADGRDSVFETEQSIERSAASVGQRWFVARVR
ncbi:hypothetical protein [Candidatus Poriferisodalis sp.]|uniref:hypothetical protein n=1 Tax=Candidatus Poriferisodalis sp. TaxID=3101277 RepID=UPI003B02BD30